MDNKTKAKTKFGGFSFKHRHLGVVYCFAPDSNHYKQFKFELLQGRGETKSSIFYLRNSFGYLRGVRFGAKVGEIGTKWDKSGTF